MVKIFISLQSLILTSCLFLSSLTFADSGDSYTTDVNQYFYTSRSSNISFLSDIFYSNNYSKFPLNFGNWSGELKEQSESPYIRMWYFTNLKTDEHLYFMMVYDNLESDFHIPELCYINDGWFLDKRQYKTIKIGENQIQTKCSVAEYDGNYNHIYYFFTWKTALRNLAQNGAYMFRISVVADAEPEIDPDITFASFIDALKSSNFGDKNTGKKVYKSLSIVNPETKKKHILKEPDNSLDREALNSFILSQIVPNTVVPIPAFKRYGLVLSYSQRPDSMSYKYTFSRSAVYDNALSVIALSMSQKYNDASKIISGSVRSVRPNGDLWFTLNTHNTWPDENDNDGAIIRSGASSWMGYAICYFLMANLSDNPNILNENSTYAGFLDFAEKMAVPILKRQVIDTSDPRHGLISGGYGTYVYKLKDGVSVTEEYKKGEVSWCSIEHNIDAYFYLRELGFLTGENKYNEACKLIKEGLLNSYNKERKQFNRGMRPDGPDRAMALDCASWGAMFLQAIGENKLAKQTLEACSYYQNISDGILGYKPYIDMAVHEPYVLQKMYYPLNPKYAWNDIDFVWSEGSFGVCVAQAKIGSVSKAKKTYRSIIQSRLNNNGAISYADKEIPYQFSSAPSVIGSAWAVLAEESIENTFFSDLFWGPPQE